MSNQVQTHGILWCFAPGKNSPCKMKKETEDCVNCSVRAWERGDEDV